MNTTYIWNHFADNILHFIEKRVNNSEDAKDIRQDIFIKIHLKLVQIQHTEKILPWIYQIVRNSIRDYYRYQYKKNQEQERWLLQAPQYEENQAEHQELFCCLTPFLDNLSEKYKIVMEMHYQKGIKQHEIAKELGISISGVKSRIQRAREVLKQEFTSCCGYHLGKDGYLKGEQDCSCHH